MKAGSKCSTILLLLLLVARIQEVRGFLRQPRLPSTTGTAQQRFFWEAKKINVLRRYPPMISFLPFHDRKLGVRGGSANPPLSRWVAPALASALSYALYNISIKKGASSISPMLGGVILQVVAAALGSILLGCQRGAISASRKGIFYSVLAGLFVGAAEILSFQVSATGAQASQSVPVMIGGSVVIGSILGAVLLRERMSWQGWFGVVLVVAGIACVATDPASNFIH